MIVKKFLIKIYRFIIGRYIKLSARLHGVQLGKDLRAISPPIWNRYKGSKIIIGNNCIIHNSSRLNIAGVNHATIIATLSTNSLILIGDRVGISGASIVARDRIIIEDDVMIGVNVSIYDNDFHPINMRDRIEDCQDKIDSAPITLKRGCWIGANAIILKGVSIGVGSIVAAGSIVTRSVPDGVIVGGNPATIIRNDLNNLH